MKVYSVRCEVSEGYGEAWTYHVRTFRSSEQANLFEKDLNLIVEQMEREIDRKAGQVDYDAVIRQLRLFGDQRVTRDHLPYIEYIIEELEVI